MAGDNQKPLGALWKKTSKAGNGYMSGTLDFAGAKIGVVVFENTRKKSENSPDFTIFRREDRNQAPAAGESIPV